MTTTDDTLPPSWQRRVDAYRRARAGHGRTREVEADLRQFVNDALRQAVERRRRPGRLKGLIRRLMP